MIRLFGPRKRWSAEEVRGFISLCRASDGIPMFKTRFGGVRFEDGRTVLAVCYAPRMPVSSVVFTDVPAAQMEELERTSGDWKLLWARFGGGSPLP